MYCIRNVTEDLFWIGANDHRLALFENAHPIPNGVSYNSYVLLDEKTVLFDTVDWSVCRQFLENLEHVLNGRPLDYIVVNHFEPDHGASLEEVLLRHPEATIICSTKAVNIIKQFNIAVNKDFDTVKEGDTRCFGKHTVAFVEAPMVHWPEVIMTYDSYAKVFFSADAFGKFGALDVEEDWTCEARRYYFGIVGKYGAQVQALLKKTAGLDIQTICPLHGPVLNENLDFYRNLYQTWSAYEPEDKGVLIAYTSVYGNTKKAAELLAQMLVDKGCEKVAITDLARDDIAEAVEDAFRYDRLVLATTTYNGDVFPFMREFIESLTERNYQKRTIGLIENGSWAATAAKVMRQLFEKSKEITFTETTVKIMSALNEESTTQLENLAEELCK